MARRGNKKGAVRVTKVGYPGMSPKESLYMNSGGQLGKAPGGGGRRGNRGVGKVRKQAIKRQLKGKGGSDRKWMNKMQSGGGVGLPDITSRPSVQYTPEQVAIINEYEKAGKPIGTTEKGISMMPTTGALPQSGPVLPQIRPPASGGVTPLPQIRGGSRGPKYSARRPWKGSAHRKPKKLGGGRRR